MKKKSLDDLPGNLIIRLMVGLVFLSEGLQKFLFPGLDGVGRFSKIGIPYPAFFAPFTGVTEIVCGLLLLIGLITRIAAIPLLIVICSAIYTTKLPMLGSNGFWPAMHESRADLCMLLGLIFLLCYGAGKFSMDNKLGLNGKR